MTINQQELRTTFDQSSIAMLQTIRLLGAQSGTDQIPNAKFSDFTNTGDVILRELMRISDEHAELDKLGAELNEVYHLAVKNQLLYAGGLGKKLEEVIDYIKQKHEEYMLVKGFIVSVQYTLLKTICDAYNSEINVSLAKIKAAEMQLEATREAEAHQHLMTERRDDNPRYDTEKEIAKLDSELKATRLKAAISQTTITKAEQEIVNAVHRMSNEESLLLEGILQTRKSLITCIRGFRAVTQCTTSNQPDSKSQLIQLILNARHALNLP